MARKILTLKSKLRPTSLKLLRIIKPSETLKARCALPRKTSPAIKLYVEFQSDPGPLEAHPWILRESDPRLGISCRRKKSLQTDRADVRKDLETNASGSVAESGTRFLRKPSGELPGPAMKFAFKSDPLCGYRVT